MAISKKTSPYAVFLGHLPVGVTSENIHESLKDALPAFTVSYVQKYRRKAFPRFTYAFLCFDTEQDMEKALANKSPLTVLGAPVVIHERHSPDDTFKKVGLISSIVLPKRSRRDSCEPSGSEPLDINRAKPSNNTKAPQESSGLDFIPRSSCVTFGDALADGDYSSLTLPSPSLLARPPTPGPRSCRSQNSPSPPPCGINSDPNCECVLPRTSFKRLSGSSSSSLSDIPPPLAPPGPRTNVVFIDGIPATCNSRKLFGIMSTALYSAVDAVLVYHDCDERALKQGLAEISNPHTIESLCGSESVKFGELNLSFRRSEVRSIAAVRDSYGGEFTVHIRGQSTSNPDLMSALQGQTSFDHNTPLMNTPLFTPRIDEATPGTEASDTEFDGKTVIKYNSKPTYEFNPIAPTNLQLPNVANLSLNSQMDPNARFTVYTPDSRPSSAYAPVSIGPVYQQLVASRTIIVDDMTSMSISQAHDHLMALSKPYGTILSLDMVQTNNSSLKAFITFLEPVSAQVAAWRLQSYPFGASALTVHMA